MLKGVVMYEYLHCTCYNVVFHYESHILMQLLCCLFHCVLSTFFCRHAFDNSDFCFCMFRLRASFRTFTVMEILTHESILLCFIFHCLETSDLKTLLLSPT